VLVFFINIGYYSMKARQWTYETMCTYMQEDERIELKVLIHKVISMPKITVFYRNGKAFAE